MSQLSSRNKTPVIVGGTFYYCESLMFENYLSEEKSEKISLSELKKLKENKLKKFVSHESDIQKMI